MRNIKLEGDKQELKSTMQKPHWRGKNYVVKLNNDC